MIDNLHRIMQLVERGWDQTHALVVGDVMLDKYLWGEVGQISPEAPVPIVRAGHRSEQPGGAANAAMNLAGLGSQVTLLGFAGGDGDREALESLPRAAGIACYLARTGGVPTTAKLRIPGGNQQMLRLDTESYAPRRIRFADGRFCQLSDEQWVDVIAQMTPADFIRAAEATLSCRCH